MGDKEVKFSRKDIIGFLFPELQIVETIKEYGFITMPNKSNKEKKIQNMEQVQNSEVSTIPEIILEK